MANVGCLDRFYSLKHPNHGPWHGYHEPLIVMSISIMKPYIHMIFALLTISFISVTWAKNSIAERFEGDRASIEAIFDVFDEQMNDSDDYLKYLADDVILMAHNVPEIRGRAAYVKHIAENRSYGVTEIEHKLIELFSYEDVVIARGRAIGTFQAKGATDRSQFETKNVFIFRRAEGGGLKVWQIIFNMNP